MLEAAVDSIQWPMRIVDFDTEVPHRALELRMFKPELHCTEILRSQVDQGHVRATRCIVCGTV